MGKHAKPPAKPGAPPALPEKLRRSLDQKRGVSAQPVARARPQAVSHRQGPSRQRRG